MYSFSLVGGGGGGGTDLFRYQLDYFCVVPLLNDL